MRVLSDEVVSAKDVKNLKSSVKTGINLIMGLLIIDVITNFVILYKM